MPKKPDKNLYPEYYQRYTDLLEDGDILEILKSNMKNIINDLSHLSDNQAEYRYADDKWSIKEVLGHIIDAERIFLNRTLRIARNDKIDIPQYDHNAYVSEANFDEMSLKSLIAQYEAGRISSLLLFESFNETEWNRIGTASGQKFIASCFPYVLAGHELHHLGIIKERYLHGV